MNLREPAAEALSRRSIRDEVRDAIVRRITSGVAPPGTRLKQLALARELNVSQAPVREAIRELEALGILESRRYRGTRVRTASPAELRDAYTLRAVIENAAARQAVPASQAELLLLESIMECLLQANRQGDSGACLRNAMAFHRHVVAMSRNAWFLRVWERLCLDCYAGRAPVSTTAPASLLQVRLNAVAAIRAGDGSKAGCFLSTVVKLEYLTLKHE